MVLLGVNVAVITAEPALPTSNFVPEIATTDVSADEYVQVPVAAVVATAGDTMVISASLYVASTFDQLNVGVALLTVNVEVVAAVV